MKTTLSPALLAAALLASAVSIPSAFGFTEVARGSLILTTTGRIAYDSNIAGNASEIGDTLFTLAPTLKYARAAGLGSIDTSLGVAFNRYRDHRSLNSEDIETSLNLSLPTPEGARNQGGIAAGYTDVSRIDETIGTRIRSKIWTSSFSDTYRVGTRVDLHSGFGYSDVTRSDPVTVVIGGLARKTTTWHGDLGFDYTDFLGGFGLEGNYRHSDTQSSATSILSSAIDQTSNSVSSGLFYRFASGLRASTDLGYRWINRSRTETLAGGTSDNGVTFGVKLDGPFLPASRFPKLKSSFSIGVEKGDTIGVGSTGTTTVVGHLSLGWQARERTSFNLTASRVQGLSTANESTIDNSIKLGVTQLIGNRTHLSANLGEDWNTYPVTKRDDHRTRGGLDLTYSLNRNWQAGANYTITLSRSNHTTFDYDRHLVAAFVACTF